MRNDAKFNMLMINLKKGRDYVWNPTLKMGLEPSILLILLGRD